MSIFTILRSTGPYTTSNLRCFPLHGFGRSSPPNEPCFGGATKQGTVSNVTVVAASRAGNKRSWRSVDDSTRQMWDHLMVLNNQQPAFVKAYIVWWAVGMMTWKGQFLGELLYSPLEISTCRRANECLEKMDRWMNGWMDKLNTWINRQVDAACTDPQVEIDKMERSMDTAYAFKVADRICT